MRAYADALRLPLCAHLYEDSIYAFVIQQIHHTKFLETVLEEQISAISTKIHKLDLILEINYDKLLLNLVTDFINNNLIKLAFLQPDNQVGSSLLSRILALVNITIASTFLLACIFLTAGVVQAPVCTDLGHAAVSDDAVVLFGHLSDIVDGICGQVHADCPDATLAYDDDVLLEAENFCYLLGQFVQVQAAQCPQ